MLELVGCRRRFGDRVALDGLDLTVPAGAIVGFLGPNGAGKTTTMRAVLGIVPLDHGTITWHGRPVGHDERRRFGYLPEERGLYGAMGVRDHLVYLARLHGVGRRHAGVAATQWLERLGVAERADATVESLSLGLRQRVQLAAALAHEPELLVLDEPLSGLDPPTADLVGAVLAEQAAHGVAVLLSSHQLELVEGRCPSVAIVAGGRVVAAGTVAELCAAAGTWLDVAVAGDGDGRWASGVTSAHAVAVRDGVVRLELAPGSDPQQVLAVAQRAGAVTRFVEGHAGLAEVFRAAVGPC